MDQRVMTTFEEIHMNGFELVTGDLRAKNESETIQGDHSFEKSPEKVIERPNEDLQDIDISRLYSLPFQFHKQPSSVIHTQHLDILQNVRPALPLV
ncbi:hypothetical protein LAZ67_23000495 [Cordylochernes scorpioides]|uniref:Uncharacterized protein n=1 Tax=Cordylochernes scorpioides TaxID=51811 RepID=A0ABY6LQG1_9ARAC|nr:hypothetical protein LAZ67_23000495 [Cordylochernes scorpioides]